MNQQNNPAVDNFEQFIELEKQLNISDKKTLERILWYWQTYFKKPAMQTAQAAEMSDEEAAENFAMKQIFINDRWKDEPKMQDHLFNEYIAKESFLAGCQHVRQQLQRQVDELRKWKESALAVMPDMQAIGKALKIPLGQSIHDKILPAIRQLQSQQQAAPSNNHLPTSFVAWFTGNDEETITQVYKDWEKGSKDKI